MTAQRDARWSRAVQVGMLMRAYREGFPLEDGKRGLTQAGLLKRMSEVNGQYAERYSHVTVSRWESGTTLPTAERLHDFGTALNLTPVEVEGLMILAGLRQDSGSNAVHAPDSWGVGAAPNAAQQSHAPSTDGSPIICNDARGAGNSVSSAAAPDMGSIIRYLSYKCVLMGVGIAVLGYALAAFGWDNSWMPVVYVAAIMCLVMAQGLLRRRRPHDLGEFYGATIFFLLSTFLLQSAIIRMDPYGIYTLGDYAGTHIPYLLALEVNLTLATVAGLAFHLLRQWHYSGDLSRSNAPRRAVAVTLPPTLFAYASIVVISNISLWIQLVIVLPAIAGVFMVLLVLRDPTVKTEARDRRLALVTTVALITVMGTLGAAVLVAAYLSPNMPSVLPNHNWWTSWDIDFSQLGYPQAEALERLNRGYLWHGLATFLYVVVVVGGVLFTAVYRMGGGDPATGDSRQSEPGMGRRLAVPARVRQAATTIFPGHRAGETGAGGLSWRRFGDNGTFPVR